MLTGLIFVLVEQISIRVNISYILSYTEVFLWSSCYLAYPIALVFDPSSLLASTSSNENLEEHGGSCLPIWN